MHVPVLCTINYNRQVLRNSKLSLLSTGGISYWEISLWPLCCPRGGFVAYSPLPTTVYTGEVSLLSTWMVTNLNSDSCWLNWSQTLMVTLYLKPEKCTFEQHKIEFLGVILENRTVQMDPAKVKGVADWSPPQNITDICSFLGFTGFYHYFIPNYSLIAQPLIQLTWKNASFNWDQSCTQAFKHLKSLMCAKPILWQLDYTKAFFPYHGCISLQHGCHTLTGGRTQPQNPKTNALPHCILFKHIHTDRAELWHLWKRIPRSPECLKMLQTPHHSYRNPSYYPHRSC